MSILYPPTCYPCSSYRTRSAYSTFDTLTNDNRHAKNLDADCENKLSTSYKICCITIRLEKAPLLLKKGMKINYDCRMTMNFKINWYGSSQKSDDFRLRVGPGNSELYGLMTYMMYGTSMKWFSKCCRLKNTPGQSAVTLINLVYANPTQNYHFCILKFDSESTTRIFPYVRPDLRSMVAI